MALNPIPVGDEIAAFIKANAPDPTAAVTDDQLKIIWEGIMGKIYPDIENTAVVTVASGIAVATTGGPAAQTGSTTATGTGTIS